MLDSLIVSECPFIEKEFPGKAAKLLWRGSRDGFGANEFHRRCDGHGNTVVLIRDASGNVFGGFTPVKWESSAPGEIGHVKGDESLRSFLFTLKNPSGVAARKFALKAGAKQSAICCDTDCGPVFGRTCIYVADSCNANTLNFGEEYESVSGKVEAEFLTGAQFFTVKEIEVFQIAN
jgi:hypothetical protein